MTLTDTDLFLARLHARALDGDSFAAADVLRLLDLVERLSRELLAARSVGTPLGAAPGESLAEGSIPSSPRPLASPPSSPTPPAPEAAPGLSCSAAGSEGGHGRVRPCPDCAGLGVVRLPDCAGLGVARLGDGACLTCMGTGFLVASVEHVDPYKDRRCP